MDLVHDDMGEAFQGRGFYVDHVAQNFRGHDNNICGTVDGNIACEQADGIVTVSLDEVVVFLVAECFDRRGVEALCAAR